MTELPTVESQLPEIKILAKQILTKLYCFDTVPNLNSLHRIDRRFAFKFHVESDPDIFVKRHMLFIPIMPKEKVSGLPAFFRSIGCPYAIHHEVCHLLDLYIIDRYNLEMPSEEKLEERATEVERLLENQESELAGVW